MALVSFRVFFSHTTVDYNTVILIQLPGNQFQTLSTNYSFHSPNLMVDDQMIVVNQQLIEANSAKLVSDGPQMIQDETR